MIFHFYSQKENKYTLVVINNAALNSALLCASKIKFKETISQGNSLGKIIMIIAVIKNFKQQEQ